MIRPMKILIITLLVGTLICACSQSDGENAESSELIPVAVSTIKLGTVKQSLRYSGDIHAEYEVKVFSKIPDRIEQLYADEGDAVKKGQTIAKIIATTIEQGVKQAEAALVAARAQEANLRVEFERAQRLFKESAMSKQQYDAIQTQFEAAQAQREQAEAGLASAKSQLNDATLVAPINGIIGKRYYENGDMVSLGSPVVSIVQMDRVKVTFDATEEDLGRLSAGQEARIQVRSYTEKSFTGMVNKISPVLDPQTRMAEIEVLIDNHDKLLKPGMYAEVEVTTGTLENVMVVPRFASIESTTMERIDGEDQVIKNFYVFTISHGQAKQKKLDVRYINHKTIAVNDGIAVGDTMVITGQNNLRDGMGVSIIKMEGSSL
jgi:membrane fusion protein (multidrug efflux system)